MAISKVIYNDQTLVDLTSDTVTAEVMLEGGTAHDKSGEVISGEIPRNERISKTIETIDEQIVIPEGYYNESGSVSIDKVEQEKLISENIKKGVNILGIQGSFLGGTPDSGTPVGEIISYMGNTAPANYLVCDGAEYSIVDYPFLTQHFTKEFGSANYFGGDGAETFAVPDLRGEFLRGAGIAIRDTGAGAEVGMHQDGTAIPYSLYYPGSSKIYFFANGKDITNEPTDRDKEYGIRKYAKILDGINDNLETTQCTKYSTRPTNTSVLYCIKYKPTYAATVPHAFSMEEQQTGTWVDGKPIYERTINFGSLPNNNTKEFEHGIENIDRVVFASGLSRSSTGSYGPLVHANPNTLNAAWSFWVDSTYIYFITGSDRSNRDAIITLWYTKTTD